MGDQDGPEYAVINMKPRTKKLLEGLLFLFLGIGLASYSIYDSLDGSFIAASKYGANKILSITDGKNTYWLAVGFRVLLGLVSAALGILSISEFKKAKNPYD